MTTTPSFRCQWQKGGVAKNKKQFQDGCIGNDNICARKMFLHKIVVRNYLLMSYIGYQSKTMLWASKTVVLNINCVMLRGMCISYVLCILCYFQDIAVNNITYVLCRYILHAPSNEGFCSGVSVHLVTAANGQIT